MKKKLVVVLVMAVVVGVANALSAFVAFANAHSSFVSSIQQAPRTATPITHLVVLFQENVSFDHYFATYPHAVNPAGEPRFTALPETPSVNGLSQVLLTHNPNYTSTANPQHLPPTSVSMIGKTDQANHQYDLSDFWAARAGTMPAVSFLKARAYQDGHAGYSDPLDEQQFLVTTINSLQKLPTWKDTAIVIAYDDSDGWYDHVLGPIVNQSNDPNDALTGSGRCGTAQMGAYQGRCGYGTRIPLLVISPYAKRNFVDSTLH